MSSRDSRLRLARLAAEVRAERVPEPREPGLPPRLRAEFRGVASGGLRSAPPSRPAAARRWWPVFGLAAAAALALVFVRSGAPAPEGPRRVAPIATLDGQALDLGVLIVAEDRARHVEHAGRASWQLAPGSQARLVSATGGVLRVSLEQGSLAAEVEPSRQHESFVVQARGTEVAVHGTHFIVSLIGERVHVAVTRGQVQVRPTLSGRAVLPVSGTLLGPGMQADFWAGSTEPPPPPPHTPAAAPPPATPSAPTPPIAPVAPQGARPARPGTRMPAKPSAEPSAPAASAAAAPPALPRPLATGAASAAGDAPAASVEQALETVTDRVQHCFREQVPGSSELGIEATTRLGLWVEPDGELLRADFDPPLAPGVERCVASQLAHVRVARSPAGFRVERDIRLQR